jgi:hypothetical protein
MRKKLIKILSSNYLTSTVMTDFNATKETEVQTLLDAGHPCPVISVPVLCDKELRQSFGALSYHHCIKICN